MRFRIFIGSLLLAACGMPALAQSDNALAGKEITQENKPWSRWWWLGNIVDKEAISWQLAEFARCGLGGVEICPIYGVQGYEDQTLSFLSDQWLAVWQHTLREAQKYGLGVDLTCGTGWPFGGPQVEGDMYASTSLELTEYKIRPQEAKEILLPPNTQAAQAVSDTGEIFDISEYVTPQGKLYWNIPSGNWTIYAASYKSPIQKVKRAAPGSEGFVVDPYSIEALRDYLRDFDKVFSEKNILKPRCYFHDSFEYYHANWSRDFLNEFKTRRGYELALHLNALAGQSDSSTNERVVHDYRLTLSELHIEWLKDWKSWCNKTGSLARNQAHGAPANLLDLYGASDIAETEIFRQVEDKQIPMLKFASSAGHLNGQKLVSAESYTWLAEHFHASLAQLKEATDFLLISGVNHIFYHGIPYSPPDVAWPGWQFYASVNFGPSGGLWRDLRAYNAYVSVCQNFMQAGESDNDIALYVPQSDFWSKTGTDLLMTFTVHNDWLAGSELLKAAEFMLSEGWSFDYVSDSYLQKAIVSDTLISIGKSSRYKVIVVPQCHYMPAKTAEKLRELTWQGAEILFINNMPEDVPGMEELSVSREKFLNALEQFQKSETVIIDEIGPGLARSRVRTSREECRESGIDFCRRRVANNWHYFLVNRSGKAFDGWLNLTRVGKSCVYINPLYPEQSGMANIRTGDNGTEVLLSLKPGESILVKLLADDQSGPQWHYYRPGIENYELSGHWQVEFIEGGEILPGGFVSEKAQFWTNRGDMQADNFSGTATYTTELDCPAIKADNWILSLEKVQNSARVYINDNYIATLWSEPFSLRVGQYLRPGKNKLKLEVTNLAANRIRSLDQRSVKWKYFSDINVVNIDYKPLNAANW
ncbi:MAG: hypothetical protein JW745_07585, partial [Sedimentisphaerales bacterium]|nr:hypothetical protein [Sedimentisphaerales bacterium]